MLCKLLVLTGGSGWSKPNMSASRLFLAPVVTLTSYYTFLKMAHSRDAVMHILYRGPGIFPCARVSIILVDVSSRTRAQPVLV